MLPETLDIPVFYTLNENEQNISHMVRDMFTQHKTILEIAETCKSYTQTLLALIGPNDAKTSLVLDVFQRETMDIITEQLAANHSGEYEYVITTFPRVSCYVDKMHKYGEDIFLYRFAVRGGSFSKAQLGTPKEIARAVVRTIQWK